MEGPWFGASLHSRRCGINLRSVSVQHAHAASLHASDAHSQTVIKSMLSQELSPSPHSDCIVAALSVFASGCDWLCLEDTDVPLHQQSQSTAIDEALFQHLLSTAHFTHSWALLSALSHAGD